MYEKGSGVQGFQQFGVNAVKTAVAHYQTNVSRLGFLADGGDDFLRLSADQGVLAQRGEIIGEFGEVQACLLYTSRCV